MISLYHGKENHLDFKDPSKVDRKAESANRREYWKQEMEDGRIEGDATDISFEAVGRVKGGHANELTTRQRIPVKKVEKLED